MQKKHRESETPATGSGPLERRAQHTTGIVTETDGRRIGLYFTGPNHAGENLAELLKRRRPDCPPPIQMCDALSRNNLTEEFTVILSNCPVHSRRNFFDIQDCIPEECRYIISLLALVYKNDQTANELEMSKEQRLEFHQSRSAAIMVDMSVWMSERIQNKLVEPNSSLGYAIRYMQKHWEAHTLFLHKAGAPLDNNICERALKMAILSRKNSCFYKTQHGATTGDMFMSFIQTCKLSGSNPFRYLTALLEHHDRVSSDVAKWMPWNYEASLAAQPAPCSSPPTKLRMLAERTRSTEEFHGYYCQR